MPACTVPGCNGIYAAIGLCEKHYRRNRLYGDPLAGANQVRYVLAECWSQGPVDECWPWQGPIYDGVPRFHGRSAPRVVYEQLRGPVPAHQILEHICANVLCVNPDHLLVTTRSEFRGRRNRG